MLDSGFDSREVSRRFWESMRRGNIFFGILATMPALLVYCGLAHPVSPLPFQSVFVEQP